MMPVEAYVVSGLVGRQETIAGVHSHRTRCHPAVSTEFTRGADQSRKTFQNNNSYIEGYIIES